MGRPVAAHKRRLEEEEADTVREDYVKKMRDNYPLIIRTLMHDLIVSVDKEGIFVFLNDAAVDFWGKSSEEVIGTHFSDYLYPEDVEITQSTLQEMIKSKGQVKGFIVRVKSPRGARTVAWNAVAIFDAEGNYVGAQATGKDITDLLRTEEELKWSQKQFQSIFEVMVDPVVIIDLTGKILELSQSAKEILGFPKEEIVGKHFLETKAATAESKAIMAKNLEKLKSGLSIEPHPVEAITKDGKKLLYELNTARINHKGEPAILAIFRNITEQKKAEEKLQASEERFNYFLENAPEAIWVQDLIGTFLDGNRMAKELTGYKREELIGKNMLEILVPPESIPRLMEAFKPNKHGGISGPTELELIKKDGSLVSVEASTIPVEREGKINIIGIARDITERKKAELELQESLGRFKTIFEGATDGIVAIDPKTMKFVLANSRLVEITGAPLEELLNSTILDYVPKDEIPLTIERFQKQLAGKLDVVRNQPILRKDNTRLYVDITAKFMNIGNQQYIVGFLNEVTEQKKAQDALRESEKRFRELSELLPEVVFETDATGRLTFANQIAFERFSYALEDFDKGLNAFQMLIPEDRDRAKNDIDRVMSGAEIGFTEYMALRKDGSTFPIIIHSTPIIRGNRPVGLRGVIVDITDRKKAEETLKKSEERFRSTLDSMLEGCQIIDYNWHYLYVNDAAAKHGRLAKKDFIGKTMMELYPDIEQTKLFSVLKGCMKERVPAHLENEFTYPNGEKAWFELSIEPVPEGLFILTIDITDRKEVTEALRREREMLEMVTGNINAGLMVVSKDYSVLWANNVLKKYLGDVEGKPCYSAINQREDICHGCGVKEIFETGKDWVVHEQVVPTPDGKEFWLLITATAIRDENGEIVAASEMSWDVTEQKRAQEALLESEKKYREMIDAMNDTAIVVDFDGKIIDANKTAVKVLGYSLKELTSAGPEQFDATLTKRQIQGLVQKMKTSEIMVFETAHTTKDGKTFPVEVSASHVTYKGKQAILSIARDITERKRAQEAINKANGLLKQSNKELESYTYVVSHDLKAPLRTIRSFGSFILEDYGDKLDETGKDYLNRMVNASSHLDTMIEDLLVLSRVGRKFTEIEKVDLNVLLKEILADLEATIRERNAKVVVDKLPTLYAHRVWERQLFMNLISNALKFNESKTPKIEVLYREQENDHLFMVRDNGIGIEEKYLERIFNLFERAPTEKKYEGTGAGLAICKKIVEHFGGKIWVESTPGKGSTFMFTIPKHYLKQVKET
jgi:PAS domain S-box-containing protein